MGGRLFSDPVASGIDSFAKVVNVFDTLSNSAAKRRLMKEEAADRQTRRERENKIFGRQQKAWDEEDEKKYGQKTLNNLSSVYEMSQRAKAEGKPFDISSLNDDQIGSILFMGGQKGFIGDDGKPIPEKMESLKSLTGFMQSPEMQDAFKNKKKISIDLTKNKQIGDAINSIFGPEIDTGVDRAGNKASKRASVAYLDFSTPMPTVSFSLEVKPPTEGVGNLIPLQGYEKDVYSIPEEPRPPGQVERGNIDLSQRKVAINKDGTISTVLSHRFNIDGKEVLLPLVNDSGKIVSDKEALSEYKKTGRHLGIFDTPEEATAYAEKLHSSKIWQPSIDYYKQDRYDAPMTWGRDGSPDAPIKQIPAPLLGMQLNSMNDLSGWINQLEAKYGSTEFSRKVQASRVASAEREAVTNALETSSNDKRKFTRELMRRGVAVDSIDKYSKALFTEEKKAQPTKASLAFDAAGGDTKARKALTIMKDDEISVKKASKKEEEKERSSRGEINKLEGIIIRHYRKGDKNIETIDDLEIPDRSKNEIYEKLKKAENLIREYKISASEAWRIVYKTKTSVLKPIPKNVIERIKKKAKTRKEAESMAINLGFDPENPARE